MAQWFRLYESVLDDPKVQKLPPKMFRAWVNLLCLACRNDGEIPDVEAIAFGLRISVVEAGDVFSFLFNSKLLEQDGDRVVPHNWASRQYKSDGSAERMRRHRERHRNGASDVTVTPSEQSQSRADTEQNREDNSTPSDARRAEQRGSRLPEDWKPSEEDAAFAGDLGLDPALTAEGFRDYWHSLPGAKGRKLNWSKTFRNRCRDLGRRPVVGAPKETADQRRIRLGLEAIREATPK